MLRIGVTGGIGSGKTTFCSVWEKLGARVIYADALAKSLMVSNEELKKQIIRKFGDDVYGEDGSLNREYLAELAFDQGHIGELNELVHPRVHKEIEKLETLAKKDNIEIFVRESALLLDKGRPENLDAVIIVTAPEEQRIEHVVRRDQSDPDHVRRRIRNQKDFRKLEPLADLVVENNGTKEKLEKKAEIIYRELESEGAKSSS